jgi:hypothetical protein
MTFRHLIFFFVFLFIAPVVNAQGGATIKATVDKNKIFIGEPLLLTIETKHSAGSVISFVKIDSIYHFEFLQKPVIDSASENGNTTIKGIYKITSFDSGHWVIPSFILSPAVKTDTIPVDVVFSDFDPKQDYHDIKDIIEVIPAKKKQWWWYIAGFAILLAAVVVYLLRKKKSALHHVPEVMIDPYGEAMKELEKLQRDKPEAKKYHSKLTDIFRLYIFRKKGILSLQKTTADLVLQLRDLNFNKEQFDKLSQALRLSDFVKFARYVPTGDDDRNCFEEIKKSIMTLEQLEF